MDGTPAAGSKRHRGQRTRHGLLGDRWAVLVRRQAGRLGRGRRRGVGANEVVVATKWGLNFDEATKQITDDDGTTPEYLRRAVDASLRRLGTDRIDLYQLHLDDLPIDEAAALLDVLEDLVTAGKIRSPLAMGLLTGKYSPSSTFGRDDIRGFGPSWLQSRSPRRSSPRSPTF
jgi:aryl-alcohol dehydrogenase-like predicted oxidoreductase